MRRRVYETVCLRCALMLLVGQQEGHPASKKLSLASVKSRLVLPFWYRHTWVVPEKGLCMSVCPSTAFGSKCKQRHVEIWQSTRTCFVHHLKINALWSNVYTLSCSAVQSPPVKNSWVYFYNLSAALSKVAIDLKSTLSVFISKVWLVIKGSHSFTYLFTTDTNHTCLYFSATELHHLLSAIRLPSSWGQDRRQGWHRH